MYDFSKKFLILSHSWAHLLLMFSMIFQFFENVSCTVVYHRFDKFWSFWCVFSDILFNFWMNEVHVLNRDFDQWFYQIWRSWTHQLRCPQYDIRFSIDYKVNKLKLYLHPILFSDQIQLYNIFQPILPCHRWIPERNKLSSHWPYSLWKCRNGKCTETTESVPFPEALF